MSNENQYSDMSPEAQPSPTIRRENERRNVFEDVIAEDSVLQFVGSTKGHTTTARSVTAKAYSTQCLGDLSESTLQQLLKERSAFTAKNQPQHQQQAHPQQAHPFNGPGRSVA